MSTWQGRIGADGAHPPRATVELDLRCTSEQEARAVWAALSQDDPGSVRGEVVGDHLRIVVGPATLASLRASCDDVLACFQAARGTASRPAGTGGTGPHGGHRGREGV